MSVDCLYCGTGGQEAGKYCANCGRLIPAVAAGTAPEAVLPPAQTHVLTGPSPAPDNTGIAAPAPTLAAHSGQAAARFGVVRDGQANPAEGFSITRTGEFLVGRLDTETNSSVDVDVRQWIQPVEVRGARQYLVHRHQCYLGLTDEGVVTVRACQGAEGDTLVRAVGSGNFVPLQRFSTVRSPHPDTSPSSIPAYPLQVGDRIYLGDPEALRESEAGNMKARGAYLMLELL